MHKFLEELIIRTHIDLLASSYSPAVSSVLNRLKDTVEREALDHIYKDVDFNINEDDVSAVLVRIRATHTRYGESMFDAQNILFPHWTVSRKLLGGG
jgi:hypothetical protein